jgi:two-component system, OmpR family, response regulator
MLVLSRRLQERIVFPDFDTSVEVVTVRPGVVRLGVKAPLEVTVLRGELVKEPGRTDRSAGKPFSHAMRNRLHAAGIGLALLRRQLQAGLHDDAAATLDRIEAELHAAREDVEAFAPPSRPAARSRKALLVEDDANECELMAGLLRMAGIEVATANDGGDALDYLQEQPRPDVVLMDMMMPRCDGPTTVRAIRREPSYAGLKIFAVSARAPDGLGLPQDETGIDRWFRKPINPEVFLREVTAELTPHD